MKTKFKYWIGNLIEKYFSHLIPEKEVIVEVVSEHEIVSHVIPERFSQDRGHLILTNILKIIDHYQYNKATIKIQKILNVKTVIICIVFDRHQSYTINVSYKDVSIVGEKFLLRGLDSKKIFFTFGENFHEGLENMNCDLKELFWQRTRGFRNEIRFNKILANFLRKRGLQSSLQLIFNRQLNIGGVDVALIYKQRIRNLYLNFQIKSAKRDLKENIFYRGTRVHFILVNDNISDLEIRNEIEKIVNPFVKKNNIKQRKKNTRKPRLLYK
ncbi:MAG: hypothetical protein LR005_00595 [Candidatus Pacebacteria bacterium]|nr:hypothetical protein [Candidatus Paceibacterota bacterium]